MYVDQVGCFTGRVANVSLLLVQVSSVIPVVQLTFRLARRLLSQLIAVKVDVLGKVRLVRRFSEQSTKLSTVQLLKSKVVIWFVFMYRYVNEVALVTSSSVSSFDEAVSEAIPFPQIFTELPNNG